MKKKKDKHILTKKQRQKEGNTLQKLLKKNKSLNKKRIQVINQAYKNKKYKLKLSKAQKSRFRKKQEREKISNSLKYPSTLLQ
jgi:type II secretory pathway component PulF